MMSLQRHSSTLIMYRKVWYKSSSAATIPITQWAGSYGTVCSIVGSFAISIVFANSRDNGIISSCKCESEYKSNKRQRRENLHLLHPCTLLRNSNHDDYETSTRILAGSPHQQLDCDISVQHESLTKPTRRKWWRLQWWQQQQHPNTHNNNTSSSWWQSLHRTVITLTRGIEIVVRLSPLIVLTPIAVAASNMKSLWNNNNRYLLHSNNKGEEDGNHDDLFAITQFQSISSSQQQHQHHSNNTTWVSDLAWWYTLHTLQCLGPAFVKLGQWAATRRDLFPVHICIRLSKLHDTANVHAWKYTHQSLVEAFGEDYESRGLVVREDDDILGSGSAAQVHRGTLSTVVQPSNNQKEDVQQQQRTTTTKDVAIKVLHPNTRQLVERDLELMTNIAQFIDKCIPLQVVKMLSLPRAVSNFANVMSRQVDLRIEGANLQTFRGNFGCYNDDDDDNNNNGFTTNIKRRYTTIRPPPTITFPKPEQDWISEKVLVEEHAGDDALPISIYLADDSPEGLERRKRLAGPLLRGFLKMVFIDNFIHSDLHPGNVLVKAIPTTSSSDASSNNPRKKKQVHYTIIFLDAGIATSLQPNDKKNLKDLFKAVVLNDGYTAGELMVERARYERCTSIPGGKHEFAQGVADIVEEFHDRRKQGK